MEISEIISDFLFGLGTVLCFVLIVFTPVAIKLDKSGKDETDGPDEQNS